MILFQVLLFSKTIKIPCFIKRCIDVFFFSAFYL